MQDIVLVGDGAGPAPFLDIRFRIGGVGGTGVPAVLGAATTVVRGTSLATGVSSLTLGATVIPAGGKTTVGLSFTSEELINLP